MLNILPSPKVFVSHSATDSDIARRLEDELRLNNILVESNLSSLKPGQNWKQAIEDNISANDFLIVLLSPSSVSSELFKNIASPPLLNELNARNVVILPVLVADVPFPHAFASIGYVDLRNNFDRAVSIILRRLNAANEIDFTLLNLHTFTLLVGDLLTNMGFSGITYYSTVNNLEFDIVASLSSRDNPNIFQEGIWLANVKLYNKSRLDLSSAHNFVRHIASLPNTYYGLLITNGHITSVTKDWLSELNEDIKSRIQVIDGIRLKQLILQYPEIVGRHFRPSINE